MGLLSRLKTALGLGSGRSEGPDTNDRDDGGVRVEREPDASTEATVKGTEDVDGGEPAATDTDAAGSTGSITETSPESPGSADVAEAAEPAEAAGPASQVESPADDDAVGEGDERTDDTADEQTDERTDEPTDDRPVREISGIGPAYERRLNEAGVETVGELAAADAAALAEATDVAQGRVENWIERAREAAE